MASAYLGALLRATADADNADELYAKPQRIERGLLEDVIALATTPQQQAGIQRVERAWRRDRASALQSPFGDTADVVEMVRRLRHDELEPIAEILLEYELEIDPIRRAQVVELPLQPPVQPQPAERTDSLELRAKTINIKFALRIKQMLPEDDHERWDRAVREAFWPEPYERSGPEKSLETLRRAVTLTEEQRAQLEGIARRHYERLDPIKHRWAIAIDAGLHAQAAEDWNSAAQAQTAIDKYREQRRRLDEDLMRMLDGFRRERDARRVPR